MDTPVSRTDHPAVTLVPAPPSTPSLAYILDAINTRNGFAAARLLGLKIEAFPLPGPAAAYLHLPTATVSVRVEEGAPASDLGAAIAAEIERVLRPFAAEVA